jgi:hypothetical protein
MSKRVTGIVVAAVFLAIGGSVSADNAPVAQICQAPGPPPPQTLRPTHPVKPVQPSCIEAGTMISHCRPAVLNAFNASVEDYNAKLRRYNADAHLYVDQLNHWSQSAVDYANCEIDVMNREQ